MKSHCIIATVHYRFNKTKPASIHGQNKKYLIMGPKKKLSKKEKSLIAAEQAEKQRAEAEKERQRFIQEEKDRIEKDRLENECKTKLELQEQEARIKQLQTSIAVFKKYSKEMFQMELENRKLEEWNIFLKCDGLPDPASVAEMNTYLYLWQLDDSLNEIRAVNSKTDEMLGLLGILEELIDFPLEASRERVDAWKEIRNTFRVQQQKQLDAATYRLLKNMEENLDLIGLNEVRYKYETKNFILSMWSVLPLPKSMKQSDSSSKIIKICSFDELGISLQMPESLGHTDFTIRALHLKYDHYSDLSLSWDCTPLPGGHAKDLLQLAHDEWKILCSLQRDVVEVEIKKLIEKRHTMISQAMALVRYASASEKKSGKGSKFSGNQETKTKSSVSSKPGDSLQNEQEYEMIMNELHNLQPPKASSQLFSEQEDKLEMGMKKYLSYVCKPNELNLRKNVILGGILDLTLLQQLPQPYKLPKKFIITITHKLPNFTKLFSCKECDLSDLFVNTPHELEHVPFHVKYTPPPPPEPGQRRLPEEIEAELKKQEEQLEKLPLINIVLPESVLWFEPPTVVIWDVEGYWSTADCHDFKFNEDKQILTFRLGRFGPLGLATYRYCNLPLQTWELKPDLKGKRVFLSITANIVVVEFTVKDDKVCLSQLQNGATAALQEIVGIYYKPHVLQRIMRRGGVDIFPDHDACCYVEGCSPKQRIAEDHLYHCIALLSTSHNFTWSRWNLLAGRRKIVLQMREYLDRRNLPNHNTLYVTPQRALLVDCTEVSQSFNEAGLPGMKFYADLYQLVEDYGSSGAKKKYTKVSFTLVETVFEMLKRTRVLSYS